ncbi:MAG: tyrosinase family protein [Candidatus Nanopelagicales bacterium]
MTRPPTGPLVAAIAAVSAVVLTVTMIATPALSALRGGVPRGDVTMLVRQNVKDLTPAQKAAFVAAVKKAKRTPSPWDPSISYYDQFVWWHKMAFQCDVGWKQSHNWAGAAHNSPTFLPWHREFLHLFDQMIQQMSGDPTMTVPYWDWTDPASTAAVFSDDFMGGNGKSSQNWAVTSGPFRKGQWGITIQDPAVLLKDNTAPKPYLVRNFGAFPPGPTHLPTAADVSMTLQGHLYDHSPYNGQSPVDESFRNSLEGWRDAKQATCTSGWIDQSQRDGSPHVMHNVVHLYVGGVWSAGDKSSEGTMAYNTSPNDPVFFLHHANVDRIWAAWEAEGGSHYKPQSGADYGWNAPDTMWPWYDRTINSWFGTERNGYRYASLPQ